MATLTKQEYSISDVADLSGIPQEKLRAWEQRLHWPRPRRDDNGYRVYSAGDLREVVAIGKKLKEGHPISDLIDASTGLPYANDTRTVSFGRLLSRTPKPASVVGIRIREQVVECLETAQIGRIAEFIDASVQIRPEERAAAVYLPIQCWLVATELRPEHRTFIANRLAAAAGSALMAVQNTVANIKIRLA